MSSDRQPCRNCGTPTANSAIEGFCPRCLAAVAFLDEPPGLGAYLFDSDTRLGDYQLLEEIGHGGMGTVYRARQLTLNREVALKVLRGGPRAGEREVARFLREAAAAASLRHPHIVTVYEVGETDGHFFFSMELVRGPTLADLTREAPLEPHRAARYTQIVAQAVAAAHNQSVLHLDLKPGNVLLDSDDHPRVTDFGLARRMDLQDDTLALQVQGTPGYMAPEQADPARGRVSVRTDVYGIGALLYHLLIGHPPFSGATVTAAFHQILHSEPVHPRRLNPSVPRDLETICLKCLHKEPSRRFPHANALAQDLAAFLANRPIRARPVSPAERLFLWSRRRPAMALLAVMLAIALMAGAAAVAWQRHRSLLNLYAADLHVASEAIRAGDLGRARELLAPYASTRGEGDLAWRLLDRAAAGDARTVLGFHPWIVGAIAWSPDGQHLLSASVGSGTVAADIRLWNPMIAPVQGSIVTTQAARQLFWFPDGRRFAAAHFDGRVRIWDAYSRTEITNYAGRSAQLSSDGRWLLTCEGDPFAWTTSSPAQAVTLYDLVNHSASSLPPARFATLSPCGRLVALTDFAESVGVYEAATGRLIRSLTGSGPLWSLSFSPDSQTLVAAGFDRDIRVWQLDLDASEPRRLQGHSLPTWNAVFSPDSQHLVSTSSDQTLRLWNIAEGSLLRVYRGHGSEVWCAAIGPQGRLASGGKDRAVILWADDSAHPPSPIECPIEGYPLLSGDGRWLITHRPLQNALTRIYDLTARQPPQEFQGPRPIAASMTPPLWIGQFADFTLQTYTLPASTARQQINLHHDPKEIPPEWWAGSADGSRIAGVSRAGRISLWNARTGARLGQMQARGMEPWHLHLSPDANRLAVTAGEQGFWICNFIDQSLHRITAHLDQGKWAAFSPDGRVLATASVDATIRLWRVTDLRPLATLRGHRTEVTALAFAPDRRTLASIELGLGVRLWNLPTLREVAVIDLPEAGDWLAFTPDSTALAVKTSRGTVRLLSATPSRLSP